MYDRMVNYNGLRNLIWVYTTEPNDADWYPGDQYVDIVGRDIYTRGDHSSQVAEFNRIYALFGGKKIVAYTEAGSIPDPDNQQKDGAAWSWVNIWSGDYVTGTTWNSTALWKKTLSSDYILTLDEMPSLKN
jgi:mannan endo-1,4-beta-mannosidase